jgi:hypothetical protein
MDGAPADNVMRFACVFIHFVFSGILSGAHPGNVFIAVRKQNEFS